MTDSSTPGAGSAPVTSEMVKAAMESAAHSGFALPSRVGDHSIADVVAAMLRAALRVPVRPSGEPSPEAVKGFLEVGANENGEIVINHPDLKPDVNGVGHIVFSPDQARHLAQVLTEHADQVGALSGQRTEGEPLREAERGLARRCVWWDGSGEDGCFYCEGEYIGDTEHVAHRKDCAVPIVRLDMIGELMVSDPAPDSTEGKHLKVLVDAQEAHEKATIPLRSSQGGAASTPEGEP